MYNYKEMIEKWKQLHPRLSISEVADDLIRDNHFSSKQIAEIRDAEYHSRTHEEFREKLEKII